MWQAGVCTKLEFGVIDKMGIEGKYNIVYEVEFVDHGIHYGPYVSGKIDVNNSNFSNAVFPDDFVSKKALEQGLKVGAESFCKCDKLFWKIYVNGRLIKAGSQAMILEKYEANGKLINLLK
jgi:hypothetical protein